MGTAADGGGAGQMAGAMKCWAARSATEDRRAAEGQRVRQAWAAGCRRGVHGRTRPRALARAILTLPPFQAHCHGRKQSALVAARLPSSALGSFLLVAVMAVCWHGREICRSAARHARLFTLRLVQDSIDRACGSFSCAKPVQGFAGRGHDRRAAHSWPMGVQHRSCRVPARCAWNSVICTIVLAL